MMAFSLWIPGDNLPIVNLGTGFVVEDLLLGNGFSCALNTEGGVKCWGQNPDGRLGYGHTDTIGDNSNEMGDYLDYVDLGTGFVASHLATGGISSVWGAGSGSVCVVSTENEVKCWGSNNQGQLGIGDTVNRGDQAGQMGDSLPYLNLSWPMTTMCDAAEMYGVDWHELVSILCLCSVRVFQSVLC